MADGMLFTTAIDGSITARDALTGSILWHEKLGLQYNLCGTPAVAGGVVYACFADIGLSGYYGKLFALDELTGYTLWSAGNEEAFNIIINTEVTLADGLVFVSTQGPAGYPYPNPDAVIAFGALNGTVVWAHETNDTSSGGPAVGGGRLFVPTSTTNEIYSLDEFTGALLWTRSLDGQVLGSPTAADGCVFAGTLGGTMYALDEVDGSIVWQVGGWGSIQHSTPVFNGTTVFFGTSSGSVCALDSANGSIVWTLSTSDIIESSLAYANGYLFYSSLLGFLKVVNASSGKVVQTLRLGTFSMSTSSPAVSDGWVWLESDDGQTFGFLGRVQVGLQVTPVLQSKDASPGMNVAYYIDIKNTGTSGADVFDADAILGSKGWPVELFESDGSTPLNDSNSNGLPDTGSISTSSSKTIVASVSVPSSSVANDLETSLIRFASSNDPSISKTASLSTYVPPPGVALFPNSYNASAPGRTERAVVELRNTGALVDVFSLNVTSSLGWSTSLFQADGVTPFTDTDGDGVNDTGSVPGLMNHTIVVSVTVPSGAGVGAIEETTVRATSTRDTNSSAHVLITIELPGLPTDDWPTSQHDSARTGASSSSFALPMSKSWTYAGGNLYYESTSPVVTGNTVYYGSVNGNLTAIDRITGKEKWTTQLGMVGRPMSSPTLGNGVLYIGYTSPFGFDSVSQIGAQTGLVDWTFYTDDAAGFGTPVLKHGVLYAADRTGVLYALDPNLGTYQWKRGLGGAVELGPSVIDGFVMAGTLQNDVFALALDGEVAWKTTVDSPVNGPIVGGGGRVYFTDAAGSIYGLDSQTGSQVWKKRVGDGSRQLQLAYSEGVLYASGTIVAALNSTTGVYLWIHGPTVTYWTTLVVDRGLFFTTGEDGVLYVLNSTHGNSSASFFVHAFGIRNPPALMKGYLYVTDNSGGLTRFKFAGAGDPSNLALTLNSNSVVIGGSKTLSASVQDRYGNTLSNQTFNWSVESGSGTIFKVGERGEQAMFVAGLISGASTITVSIGSHNASASINILPGAPHDLTITPDGAAIGVGDFLAFSATVRDTVGNLISDSEVTWSSTIGTIGSSAAFFAGTTAGAGLVRATCAGLTAEVAVTVLPGALFNISISPSELRLEPQATALITATGYDSFGNELPESMFSWTTTIGSLLPSGVRSQMVLQAGYSVGTGVVTVTGGGIDATVQVVVVPGPVVSLVLSPAILVLGTGSFQDLEVRAYDAFGNLVPDATFEWSSTGEGDWSLSLTSNSIASFYSGTSGGNAIITVTLGSKVVTLVITISPEPVKQRDLAMVYAFGATAVVLACIVVVLLWMLFRRRPGMTAPSPEARTRSPDSDAPK
jgi:outer membrane protein assembly factor BamB